MDRYCELLVKLDKLQRQQKDDSPEGDRIFDEMEVAWEELDAEGRKRAREYSAQLKEEWSPKEKYVDATETLKRLHPSWEISRVWEKRRDEAWAMMTEAERAEVTAITTDQAGPHKE